MADEHEPRSQGDERERSAEPVEGAPGGGEPEVHMHSELTHEAKRLAAHPREEVHRLSEELREGEADTTPLIAITGIGLWVGLLVAILIAVTFIVAWLV